MSHRSSASVPDVVKDFIYDLYHASRIAQRHDEVHKLYEVNLKELTEKHFSQATWPTADLVASECQHDDVFLMFYTEMAYRHLFTKLKPITLNHYIDSWHNYCNIFEWLLSVDRADMMITPHWAYDIVQEFAYQFQGFCQYRTQIGGRSSDEIEALRQNANVWDLPTVVRYLRRLIGASNVREVLQTRRRLQLAGGNVDIDPSNESSSRVALLLGYFSITELSRLFCLIGNYEDALEVLEPLSLGDRYELYTQVLLCNINVFYHTGICYLMLRRYVDAMAVFSDLIVLSSRILKPGAVGVRTSASSMVQKLSDKTLSLLAIATSLCPGCVLDDQVRQMVTEKLSERLRRLEQGDLSTYEDMLTAACPKFITPSQPDYSNPASGQHTIRQQMSTFMEDVRQQVGFSSLRAYMRLYSSIHLQKLARFNNSDEAALLSLLLCFKNKLKQVQRLDDVSLGSHRVANAGSARMASDVHFYVDNDTLFVDESGAVQSTTEGFYLAGIHKHTEIMTNLSRSFKALYSESEY